jgi:hypothetical protein
VSQANTRKIPYGSELHANVLNALLARVTRWESVITKRHAAWEAAENLFTAYVHETEADAARRDRRDNQGEPQYTTIHVPYSYAMLLTAHTYYTSVFLGRDPVLQLKGRDKEGDANALNMEAVLAYYLSNAIPSNLVPLFVWLMDVGKYGYGVLGYHWEEDVFYKVETVTEPRKVPGTNVDIPFSERKVQKSSKVTGYRGARLYNVRPHNFIWDPNYTLPNFQRGEYAGRVIDVVGFHEILRREDDGIYFNVDKIPTSRTSISNRGGTGSTVELPGQDSPPTDYDFTKPRDVELIEIVVLLNPKEWGLESRNQLEHWVFTIAQRETIIGAQPLGSFTNRFPYSVIELEVDGYASFKRGMLETLEPLNKTMDWLLNTHFFNVRQTLNNQFAYDPSVLYMKDVEHKGPGKMIRVRPEYYGRPDALKSIMQLPVQPITGHHISSMQVIGDLMQRAMGVNDNVMGMLAPGGRKTATEVRSSTSFSANRLKTNCEYFSAMGFAPLTLDLVLMTQQMIQQYSNDPFIVRLVGDSVAAAEITRALGGQDLAGMFQYTPVDGSLPIDRVAQAQTLTMLFAQAARVPQVVQGFDFIKFINYIAKLQGVRDLSQFRLETQVVPDAVAQRGAAAGNLVPLAQATPPSAPPTPQGAMA